MIKNMQALLIAGLALLWSASPAQTYTANFPTKPITVVIGYPPGGPSDVFMRALAPRLTKEWSQQILVQNRPGVNEVIASQYVSQAHPDGHTLLLATEVPLTMSPFLMSKLPYDPQNGFEPVSLLLTSPLSLIVPVASPANSLKEFISLATSRLASKPLAYASAGAGGVLHLPMAMLAKQNGFEMTHVPYKGVAPLMTDVVSGQVDAAWVAAAAAAPFVRDGRVKALVVGAPSRVKALPQVPVFSETGVQPVQADFIIALLAPAGTPSPIRDKIATTIRKIMADPEFREKNIDPYGYILVGSAPAELSTYLAKDRPLQAERMRISGVKME